MPQLANGLQIRDIIARMAAKKSELKCPICGKDSDFFSEPIGPFCSNRCKLVDLGKWLGEDYRISEPLRPEHFAGFEELSGDLDRPADYEEK